MLSNPEGKATFSKEKQFSNALYPIVVTVSGRTIDPVLLPLTEFCLHWFRSSEG